MGREPGTPSVLSFYYLQGTCRLLDQQNIKAAQMQMIEFSIS